MPVRGKEISEGLRGEVIGMRKAGLSYPQIQGKTGVLQDTARQIYNRYLQSNSYISSSRSGRPKSLNDRDIRHLKRYITSGREERRLPLADISLNLNLSVCNETL